MKKIVFIAGFLLVGCTQKPTIRFVDTSCSWVNPIYVVKEDRVTDLTAGRIVAHNRKWLQFCGGKNEKKL